MSPPPPRPYRALPGLRLLCGICATLFAAGAAASPGVPSSDPEQFVRAGEFVYFTADDGIHGRELWRTDGTAQGTALFLDFHPGPEGSEFTLKSDQVLGDSFQFFVRLDIASSMLCSIDSRTGSTQQLRQFETRESNRVVFLGSNGRRCYYNVLNDRDPSGVWASDGTPEGTVFVPMENDGTLFADQITFDADGEFYITSYAGKWLVRSRNRGQSIYVVAGDLPEIAATAILGKNVLYHYKSSQYGSELWTASATPNAQSLVLDIAPGIANGARGIAPTFHGFVPFVGNDRVHGEEPWRSDGTPEGTRMIADINPGAAGADPYKFIPVGNRLLFIAMDAARGRELWVTNGEAEQTYLVQDINPGPASSTPYAFAPCGDRLFFSALSANHGEELWVAEGQPMTARLVRDIAPGTDDAAPYFTVALDNKVLFAATSPEHGRELWISDGTQAGTYELLDIYAQPYTNPGAHPAQLVAAGDKLYFVANDLEHGAELWVLDRPDAEPHMVEDIFPGPAGSNPHSLLYVPKVDRLFFVADDGRFGEELWQSNGTEDGTAWVADFAQGEGSAAPSDLVADDQGALFFVAFHSLEHGTGICRLNPDTGLDMLEGTWRVEPIWHPKQLCPLAGKLYFTADDGIHGEELWVVDGAGTRLVRDILLPPGAGSEPLAPVAWNGQLYFTADNQVSGRTLWHTIPHAPYAAALRDTLATSQLSHR